MPTFSFGAARDQPRSNAEGFSAGLLGPPEVGATCASVPVLVRRMLDQHRLGKCWLSVRGLTARGTHADGPARPSTRPLLRRNW